MILHLDMDAFFASVEQRDNPELRGRPVIVGGGQRGVVSTCSYEARAFGVRSAMPMGTARRLCPQAVVLRGRHSRYAEVSHTVMAALGEFSPLVEQASVDEAYMDATGLERLFGPLEELIARMKARVTAVTGGLTCSVGAAPVKFLAKICSDINKPNGVCILHPEEVDAFLENLPVEKLPGVGQRGVQHLHGLGIRSVGQLRRFGPDFLERRFGQWGRVLGERAQGRDPRPVEPVRAAKSESAECTFAQDTRDREQLRRALLAHAERVGASLRRHHCKGRTITLKVKFADFRQLTRSRTLPEPVNATETIFTVGAALLQALPLPQPVRLVGLGVSGFDQSPAAQLALPGLTAPTPGGVDPALEARRERLDAALDRLRHKFGTQAVQRGRLFHPRALTDEEER
ncbi:DNA polymerase IV [uncultured Desulfovibrio sp.]|uniref:DNA polymerase IV n=2 Tax=Desulfovibrio TaxID=872 RepID=UPI002204C563|nr:DNA polymerase IV [uncultured Desulfovibrio sp.]CAI3233177.1 DNA polymerase IV (EC [Desulfovibrio diazotrophicus]